MYRLIVESLLGLKLEKDRLHLEPCLPVDWEGFTVHYRYRETIYHINVKVLSGPLGESATNVSVDGVMQEDTWINLKDDHIEHSVELAVYRH